MTTPKKITRTFRPRWSTSLDGIRIIRTRTTVTIQTPGFTMTMIPNQARRLAKFIKELADKPRDLFDAESVVAP